MTQTNRVFLILCFIFTAIHIGSLTSSNIYNDIIENKFDDYVHYKYFTKTRLKKTSNVNSFAQSRQLKSKLAKIDELISETKKEINSPVFPVKRKNQNKVVESKPKKTDELTPKTEKAVNSAKKAVISPVFPVKRKNQSKVVESKLTKTDELIPITKKAVISSVLPAKKKNQNKNQPKNFKKKNLVKNKTKPNSQIVLTIID